MQLIDHYPIDWEQQTISSVRAWFRHERSPHVYLLLDAAFRHETVLPIIRGLFKETHWRSLYQDSPNTSERVLAISPLLLHITEGNLQTLQCLQEATEGNPMLSMIVSCESMEQLWQRLSAFRLVTIHDERYVLRLSDTRRLPQIVSMLTPAQKSHLTGGMLSWSYIGRDGLWKTLELDVQPMTLSPRLSEPLKLNDQQITTLLDMNRIDTLIDALRLNEPALFKAFEKPSARYDWIERTLNSTALPVETYAEQLECCRQSAPHAGMNDGA